MIGIITLYYNNYNIGGLLQAYALQKTLQDNGIMAEQLSVWHYKKKPLSLKRKYMGKITRLIANPVSEIKDTYRNRKMEWRKNVIADHISRREQHMREFMQEIPHSVSVYTPDNICESLKDYSGYVVGSDQVWNDDYIDKDNMRINMLQFVPDGYLKVSYAASIGKNCEFKGWFVEMLEELKSFDSVSVREQTAATVINEKTGVNVRVVLDPTLLLNSEQWLELCGDYNRISDEPYIFTYFLGKDKLNREFAHQISKKTNKKIINFAHAINYYRDEDKDFGDEAILDYSPKDFIKYIENASIVITDSFHATVFSLLFHKEFFTLARAADDGIKSMNSRVSDLLAVYGLSNRLIDAENYLYDDIEKIDFNDFDNTVEEQRADSLLYLKESLAKQK